MILCQAANLGATLRQPCFLIAVLAEAVLGHVHDLGTGLGVLHLRDVQVRHQLSDGDGEVNRSAVMKLQAEIVRILGLPEKGYHAVVVAAAGVRSPEDAYAKAPKVRFPFDWWLKDDERKHRERSPEVLLREVIDLAEDALAQLARDPEGLRMSALSRRLMVTSGNVTGLTDLLEREAGADTTAQVKLGYRMALGREPRRDELKESSALARAQGMETVCWALLNASEFLYVR